MFIASLRAKKGFILIFSLFLMASKFVETERTDSILWRIGYFKDLGNAGGVNNIWLFEL